MEQVLGSVEHAYFTSRWHYWQLYPWFKILHKDFFYSSEFSVFVLTVTSSRPARLDFKLACLVFMIDLSLWLVEISLFLFSCEMTFSGNQSLWPATQLSLEGVWPFLKVSFLFLKKLIQTFLTAYLSVEFLFLLRMISIRKAEPLMSQCYFCLQELVQFIVMVKVSLRTHFEVKAVRPEISLFLHICCALWFTLLIFDLRYLSKTCLY